MENKNNYPQLIREFKQNNLLDKLKKLKIAILSSYTINNILHPLTYRLYINGFNPQINFGGYNQFIQDLIDKSSWVYSFKPDIIFIALSSRTYFPDLEYQLIDKDEGYLQRLLDEKFSFLKDAVENCTVPAKVIITNLDLPVYSPYGLTDITLGCGLSCFIDRFNKKLIELSKRNSNLVILDFEKVCSSIGKLNIIDDKLFYLGKLLLNNLGCDYLALELTKFINAIYGNIKKCLIVDLDNTLWGGVIGEDGIGGIKIGDAGIGAIYEEVQKIILSYKKKGVLLVIVSKNNIDDVLPVFNNKGGLVLKYDDFIIKKINWKVKSENIIDVSKELNLGLDSFVFLDDNPVERLEVQSNLPMVNIIDFPNDVAKLPSVLKSCHFFDSISITEEDKKRHEMYTQEMQRSILKNEFPVNDYLSKLGTEISVKRNDTESIERITQLINKTNQFNLRTRRYNKENLAEMMNSNDYVVSSIGVKDKFGELGLTGVMIVQLIDNAYFIDTFLMSCRVLSRKIEHQFFIETMKFLKENREIKAEYLPTPKNNLVKNFYEELGFKLMSDEKGVKKYSQLLVNFDLKNIDWIKVSDDE